VLVVRIVGVVVAVALGVCILLWAVTGERKWLTYAWGVFREPFSSWS